MRKLSPSGAEENHSNLYREEMPSLTREPWKRKEPYPRDRTQKNITAEGLEWAHNFTSTLGEHRHLGPIEPSGGLSYIAPSPHTEQHLLQLRQMRSLLFVNVFEYLIPLHMP